MDIPRQAILCVDDDAVTLLSLKEELLRLFADRYAIETALDAGEANAAIRELEAEGFGVALVICDWFMPGLRGDLFLAELRVRKPGIKSILMTGKADGDSVRRAKEIAGISGSLSKPWRSEELVKAIEDCLG